MPGGNALALGEVLVVILGCRIGPSVICAAGGELALSGGLVFLRHEGELSVVRAGSQCWKGLRPLSSATLFRSTPYVYPSAAKYLAARASSHVEGGNGKICASVCSAIFLEFSSLMSATYAVAAGLVPKATRQSRASAPCTAPSPITVTVPALYFGAPSRDPSSRSATADSGVAASFASPWSDSLRKPGGTPPVPPVPGRCRSRPRPRRKCERCE
mmetsp:Transcript_17542/g.37929  ORF Transcript_17542/g.37929 Transcript_17542/m.37929 type:complete len:215 (+) Transcript_17542:520-1164(+)